jgi:hypothetical protein
VAVISASATTFHAPGWDLSKPGGSVPSSNPFSLVVPPSMLCSVPWFFFSTSSRCLSCSW